MIVILECYPMNIAFNYLLSITFGSRGYFLYIDQTIYQIGVISNNSPGHNYISQYLNIWNVFGLGSRFIISFRFLNKCVQFCEALFYYCTRHYYFFYSCLMFYYNKEFRFTLNISELIFNFWKCVNDNVLINIKVNN